MAQKTGSPTSLVVLMLLVSIPLSAGEIKRAGRAIPNSYIVVLNDVARPADMAVELSRAHGVAARHVYSTALRGFSFEGPESAALAMSRDRRVKYVEEDGLITGSLVQNPVPSWGLSRVDQRDLPLDTSYTYSWDGAGSVIYVIDSGINAVADIAGRIRTGRNWVPGPTGQIDPNNTADCYGHGTYVATIAAGTVYGIAKNATLVNLRVLDCQNLFSATSTIVAAVDWMTSDHLTHHPEERAAANMSLGTFGGPSPSMDTAVMNAVTSGITVVASAGNNRENACNQSPARLGNPASYPTPNGASIITVGASDSDDSVADYSNWGVCVDIFAPGSLVTAVGRDGTPSSTIFGTSYAAPHVAGIVAIHMQRFATANSPGMIEGMIKDNGTAGRLSGAINGAPNLLPYTLFPKRRSCCS